MWYNISKEVYLERRITMVYVRDVARWFLSKNSMTHKKLQKLCYYAQAWYCALYDGSPLFEDEIQAWIHGPVIPTLYPVYADYKWNDIPQADFDESVFDQKVLDILNSVHFTYNKFNGDQLEMLSHSEDPWIKARGDLEEWEVCTNPLKIEDMVKYYRKLYEQDQND